MVNLPKFKTHLFSRMTGAVKNLYGVVHGLMKVAYHSKFKDPKDFSALLLDLLDVVRPNLTIVDAVVGMEGDGPTWGRPRFVGYILAGTDPLAVDCMMCRMMGLAEEELPLFQVVSPPPVQTVGVALDRAVLKDFRLPQSNTVKDGLEGLQWLPQRVKDAFCRELLPRPHIDPGRCVGCSLCLKSCPRQAIRMTETGACVDHKQCIRCWCCNEICPNHAVMPERSVLGRILAGFL
jgi:ferredoxin